MKGRFTIKLPSFVTDNINVCGQFFNKRPFKYKNIDKTFFKSFPNFVGVTRGREGRGKQFQCRQKIEKMIRLLIPAFWGHFY